MRSNNDLVNSCCVQADIDDDFGPDLTWQRLLEHKIWHEGCWVLTNVCLQVEGTDLFHVCALRLDSLPGSRQRPKSQFHV